MYCQPYLRNRFLTLHVAAGVLAVAGAAGAAEVQLRSECRSDGGLVLLGDIADVYSQDAAEIKKLNEIDIVPAPPAGERRYLRSREVQDILVARGLNLRHLRFSGATQLTIIGTLEQPPPRLQPGKKAVAFISPRQAADEVRKALVTYLQQQSGSKHDWDVKCELTPEQVQVVALGPQSLSISGGSEPWTGPQQFTVSVPGDTVAQKIVVRAEVTLPPTLVVATRSIPRGSLIREGDVRLQPGIAPKGEAQIFQTLEEVIGKEVVKAVVEGQILDDHWVRRPLLVHKGEVVTVYARATGIQIRTTARSREEGSRGELVTVESLADRKTFFARVVAPQEVEVYAHAAGVAADAPESRSSAGPSSSATALAAVPQPPLPATRLAGGPTDPQNAAAGQVRQAAAVRAAPAGAGAEPGSILAQAALRGKSALARPPEKQAIRRSEGKSKKSKKEAPSDDAD